MLATSYNKIILPFVIKTSYNLKTVDIKSKPFILILGIFRIITQLSILSYTSLGFSNQFILNYQTIRSYIYFSNYSQFKTFTYHYQLYTALFILISALLIIIFLLANKAHTSSNTWTLSLSKIIYQIIISINLPFFGFAAQRIKTYSQQMPYILSIPPIIMVILLSISIYLYQTLNFTISFKEKDLMSRNYSGFTPKKLICLQLICFYSNIRQSQISFAETILLISSIIFLNLVDIYFFLNQLNFFYYFSRVIHILVIVFPLSFNTIAILQFAMSLFSDNNLITFLIMSFFIYFAIQRYEGYREYNLLIEPSQNIQDSHTAIHYIRVLQKQFLSKFNGSSQEMVVAGVINSHILKCLSINCFCQQFKQNNKSYQGKPKFSNRRPYKDLQFLKKFTINAIQIFEEKFPNSLSIFISILFLKLQYCNMYATIFQQIQIYQLRHSVNKIEEKYMIYSLIMTLKRFIEDKNLSQGSLKTERILELEQKQLNLSNLMENITKKFISRWQIFNTGLCDLEKLEISSKQSLAIIRQINQMWRYLQKINSFTKSVYMKFLFYYSYILFLQEQKQHVRKCINNIDAKIKSIQKIQIHNFWTLLFSSSVCTVQSLINKQEIGKIKNITKNCFNVFGYERQNLLKKNINLFIPQSLSQQHNYILGKWLQVGTWKSINTIKDAICCSQNKNLCFTSKLYLRLLATEQQLNLIATILVQNEQDYMILNKNNKIQGYGRKFLDIIGEQAYNKDFSQFCDISGFYNNATQQPKRKTVLIKAPCAQKMSSQLQQNNTPNHVLALKAYKADISYSSFIIGRIKMLKIKLQSLSKPKIFQQEMQLDNVLQIQSNQTHLKNSQQVAQRLSQMLFAKYNVTLDPTSSQNMQKSMDSQQDSSSRQSQHGLKKQKENNNNNDNNMNKLMQANSVSSSAQSFTYSLNKIITQVLVRIFNYSNIFDNSLFVTSIIIILASVAMTVIIWMQILIYKQSLNSYSNLLRYQNQNHQKLINHQILFNNALVLNQYNGIYPQDQYQNLVSITQQRNQLFFQYIKQDMDNKITAYSFSGQSFLTYLDKDVTYKHLLKQIITQPFQAYGLQIPTKFYQFNILFYLLIKKLTNAASQPLGTSNRNNINNIVRMLSQNWKTIREVCLAKFLENSNLSQQQISTTKIYLLVFIVIYILTSIIIIIVLYKFFKTKDQQRINILMISRYISLTLIKKIKDYYTMIANYSPWKTQPFANQLIIQPLSFDNQDNSGPKTQFIVQKSNKLIIFLTLLLIIINLPNAITTFQNFNLIVSISQIEHQTLKLQTSQNQLFISYEDLKVKYLFQQVYSPSDNAFQYQILADTQVDYVNSATKLNIIIAQYDSDFDTDFAKILTQNICQILKQSITLKQYNFCVKKSKLGFLQKGLLASINNIERILSDYYIQLKKSQRQGTLIKDNKIFSKISFEQIDGQIPFYFYGLNMMRDRILKSLQTTINSMIRTVEMLVIINTLFNALMMIFWIINIYYQLKNLSDYYGYILLIPPQFIKTNKLALKVIKNNLQLQT